MFELILELLPARLLIFLLGAALIGIGVYGCNTIRVTNRPFNDAVGVEGKTAEGVVTYKRQTTEGAAPESDSVYVTVNKLEISYDIDGKSYRSDVIVDGDEYASVKQDDKIKIRYHPANPDYIVTPKMAKPTGLAGWVGVIIALILGLFVIIALLISML